MAVTPGWLALAAMAAAAAALLILPVPPSALAAPPPASYSGAEGPGRAAGPEGQEQGGSFRVRALSLEPLETRAGHPVTAMVTVENTGSRAGEYTVGLLVDGESGPVATGALPPRGQRTHALPVVRAEAGAHTVEAGGVLASFTVLGASFQVSGLEVSPRLVRPGDAVQVSGWLTNTGGVAGAHDLTVSFAGKPAWSRAFLLPAGGSAPFALSVVPDRSGLHTVSAGGASVVVGALPPLVETRLPSTVEVLPLTAVALDETGGRLQVTGDRVTLASAPGGALGVTLPVAVPAGAKLGSFQEPTAGVSYRDGHLEVRVPGLREGPRVLMTARMSSPTGSGEVATGSATDLRLVLSGVEVEMSVGDGALGRVGVSMELTLKGAVFEPTVSLLARHEPLPSGMARLEEAARAQGFILTGVAMELERRGQPGLEVSATQVEVALGEAWVAAAGGVGAIRFAWSSAGGPLRLEPARTGVRDAQGRLRLAGLLPGDAALVYLVGLAPAGNALPAVQGLRLDPEAVGPGDAVVATALVAGGRDGGRALLSLSVDGAPFGSRTLEVKPGGQQEVGFIVPAGQPGTHLVQVQGASAAFQVAQRLQAGQSRAERLEVSPASAAPGEPVTLSARVTSLASGPGLASLPLEVNGVLERVVEVVLAAGGSAQVEVGLAMERPGSYALRLGGREALLHVSPREAPPAFQVLDLRLDPPEVNPGEEVVVRFVVANGGGPGIFRGVLSVQGSQRSLEPLALEALTSVPVEEKLTLLTGGRYLVEVGGATAALRVREARETSFRVTSLAIEPSLAPAGASVAVSVAVANEEPVVGADSVSLRVDGVVTESRRLWLGPGVSQRVTFTLTLAEPGEYVVDVNGVTGTLLVESVFPLALTLGAASGGALLAALAVLALRGFRSGTLPPG